MATPRQIEANQRNAQKSTGPRSDHGKAQSRINALKHGLRAEAMPVLPHENAEAYRERVIAWLEHYLPTNAAEDQLVRRAADLTWKLDRADRHEVAHLSKRVREALAECPEASETERAEIAALASFDPGPQGERLRRYQSTTFRELTRTLDTLARLRREKSQHDDQTDRGESAWDAGSESWNVEVAPNEPNLEKSVQVVFGSDPVHASGTAPLAAPSEADRPRPMTQRERALAKMIKRAQRRG